MRTLADNVGSPDEGVLTVTWFWYGLSLALVLIDQWTKQLALAHFHLGEVEPVTSFFDLTLAYNRGAAFSFLSEASGWQRWFFSLIAALVSLAITLWIWRLGGRQKLLACGLALILGGAIGNLVDRLIYGYVIDFLSFHYYDMYWPAFNVADSAITCGALVLLVDMFVHHEDVKSTDEY